MTDKETEKELRKCRAVGSAENQKQVFSAAKKPLEIAAAIPTFPQLRPAAAMEKWKSKDRIPTFPRRFIPLSKSKRKESQSRLLPLSFRLISGLENARVHFR